MAVYVGTLTLAGDHAGELGSPGETQETVYHAPHHAVPGALAVKAVADQVDALRQTAADHGSRLLVEMRAGDERALEALYDATVGKLYALAAAILRSAEDAEEIVCETYAYAWANAARYDSKRSSVLGWLLMLCRSRALDRLRQRRLDAAKANIGWFEGLHATSADQPDDILSMMQEHSTVHAALSKLTPEKRRLVSLAFLHGLSHQQIAQVTGLPLGTVKSHVRRALAQLRTALEAT